MLRRRCRVFYSTRRSPSAGSGVEATHRFLERQVRRDKLRMVTHLNLVDIRELQASLPDLFEMSDATVCCVSRRSY